ncbi:MAG: peptide chain release factor-like protein [Candidatus Scalindua sp.]
MIIHSEVKEIHLTKKDFKIDWFSGKGAGGQKRNKTQNCCRITHLETGITTTGQSNKERPANQKEAFNNLAKRLLVRLDVPEERREGNSIVREYHFERNKVTDYGSGLKKEINPVMNGEITEFMQNRGKHELPKTGRI